MLRVINEKQTNKQQQHNKDSVTQSSRVNLTQCCCVTKIFNTWSVILASVQSNLKRKKQLLHLISSVLLQLKGNPGKHLLIKENRWITNYKFSTQNFFVRKNSGILRILNSTSCIMHLTRKTLKLTIPYLSVNFMHHILLGSNGGHTHRH